MPSAPEADCIVRIKQRDWQRPLVKYFRGGGKRASVVAHRRAGKDRISLFIGLEVMTRDPEMACEVWHCLPEYAQARKTVWQALTKGGKRLIDEAFPFAIRKKTNDTEMFIELLNGSIWRLVGADNFNQLVGSNPVHVTFSEYALTHPNAWSFVRPILAENGGSALFITTYRGYNHAYDLHMAAKANPLWYCGTHPVSETKLISEAALAEERRDMPEELYRQEYECDPSAANIGAILGSRIEEADKAGRITEVELYDPNHDCIVSTDIGFRDAAAFWFWQPRRDGFALVYHVEGSGLDADDWIGELGKLPYRVGKLWLPHDAVAKTFATKTSAMERFMAAGYKVGVVPQVSKEHRINAARMIMSGCRFQKGKTDSGVKALRNWSFKWDDTARVFSREPLHDHYSNSSDAFSYGALVMRNYSIDAPMKKLPTTAMAQFKLEELFEDHEGSLVDQQY